MLSPTHSHIVIPCLVPGIHLSAGSGARGWLDPGDKRRDDTDSQARMTRDASTGMTRDSSVRHTTNTAHNKHECAVSDPSAVSDATATLSSRRQVGTVEPAVEIREAGEHLEPGMSRAPRNACRPATGCSSSGLIADFEA